MHSHNLPKKNAHPDYQLKVSFTPVLGQENSLSDLKKLLDKAVAQCIIASYSANYHNEQTIISIDNEISIFLENIGKLNEFKDKLNSRYENIKNSSGINKHKFKNLVQALEEKFLKIETNTENITQERIDAINQALDEEIKQNQDIFPINVTIQLRPHKRAGLKQLIMDLEAHLKDQPTLTIKDATKAALVSDRILLERVDGQALEIPASHYTKAAFEEQDDIFCDLFSSGLTEIEKQALIQQAEKQTPTIYKRYKRLEAKIEEFSNLPKVHANLIDKKQTLINALHDLGLYVLAEAQSKPAFHRDHRIILEDFEQLTARLTTNPDKFQSYFENFTQRIERKMKPMSSTMKAFITGVIGAVIGFCVGLVVGCGVFSGPLAALFSTAGGVSAATAVLGSTVIGHGAGSLFGLFSSNKHNYERNKQEPESDKLNKVVIEKMKAVNGYLEERSKMKSLS